MKMPGLSLTEMESLVHEQRFEELRRLATVKQLRTFCKSVDVKGCSSKPKNFIIDKLKKWHKYECGPEDLKGLYLYLFNKHSNYRGFIYEFMLVYGGYRPAMLLIPGGKYYYYGVSSDFIQTLKDVVYSSDHLNQFETGIGQLFYQTKYQDSVKEIFNNEDELRDFTDNSYPDQDLMDDLEARGVRAYTNEDLPDRVHMTDRKMDKFIRYTYRQPKEGWDKPGGFWAGVKDSWFNWEGYGATVDNDPTKNFNGTYVYQVDIVPNSYTRTKRYRRGKKPSKIYIMESEEDIIYIEKEYPPYDPKEPDNGYSHVSTELEKFLKDNYGIDSIGDAIFSREDEYFFHKIYPTFIKMYIQEHGHTMYEDVEDFDVEFYNRQETINFINWKKFAERYAGIELRNFNHDFIYDHPWYSTFDVDSVCIWEQSLIENVTMV